jgi:hypothetical protein
MRRTFFITAFALFGMVGSARAMEPDENKLLSVEEALTLFQQHEVVAHKEAAKESNTTISSDPILQQEKRFTCSRCPYKNSDASNLREHIRNIHKLCTYWCLHCDEQYRTRTELLKHYEQLPSKANNFICKNTGAFFTTWKAYRNYYASLESYAQRNNEVCINLYPCIDGKCSLSFTREMDRFKHEAREHNLNNCRSLNSTRE